MTDDIVARLRKTKEECSSFADDVMVRIKIVDVCEAYSEISLLRAALSLSQHLDEPLRCEIKRLQAYFDAHVPTIQKQSVEIERLRAALREIERINDSPGRTHQAVDDVIVAAFAGEKANDFI